jgi:hypothetical protein
LRHDFLSPAVADARAEERLLAVLVMLKRVFDGLVQRSVAWKYPHHRNEKAGEGKIAPFSPASGNQKPETDLQLFVELARRARNINPARHAALAVLHALDDPRRLPALGTISALARIHYLLTIRCFCNLRAYCHDSFLLIS